MLQSIPRDREWNQINVVKQQISNQLLSSPTQQLKSTAHSRH